MASAQPKLMPELTADDDLDSDICSWAVFQTTSARLTVVRLSFLCFKRAKDNESYSMCKSGSARQGGSRIDPTNFLLTRYDIV